MSTSFTIETDFSAISLEKFEAHLNHPKLNEMLEKGLGFSARKLLSRQEDEGATVWRFLVTKGGELPAPLKKILKQDGFSWSEESRFVPDEHCIYWEIVPASKQVKFSGHGVWQLSKKGRGCKRVIKGEINVDMPLVGKMIESLIVKELVKTYETEPKIQEQFYAEVI